MVDKEYKKIILMETIKGIFSILIFLIPFIWALIQSIFTDTSFIELLLKTPWYVYLIFILISIIVYIRIKMNEGKTNTITVYDIGFYSKISAYNDEYGMKWDIEVPNDEINWSIKDIQINPVPTCQKCGVELTNKDNYLWYTFHCFNCGLKRRTWMSTDKIRFQVRELSKIELRKKIKKD